MDLLEQARQLVARGNAITQTQPHTAYLQELEQKQPSEVKSVINNKAANKNQNNNPSIIFISR